MNSVQERPIPFSGPMVRAIQAGRKTETRRVIKGLPVNVIPFLGHDDRPTGDFGLCMTHSKVVDRHVACPYGKPGNRLWVRENFWHAGEWVAGYPEDDAGTWWGSRRVHYRADGEPPNEPNRHYPKGLCNGAYSAADPARLWRARPSIHMPRWACRLVLEIKAVRVERLHDITYESAVAEGVYRDASRVWTATDEGGACHKYPEPAFRDLWSSFKGPAAWDENPWVWVIEFEPVDTESQHERQTGQVSAFVGAGAVTQ